MTDKEKNELLESLEKRFKTHKERHPNLDWKTVQDRLRSREESLYALRQMETTGGEPDVIGEQTESGEITFMDCSKESPKGRRSLCYDRDALESRKKHKPKNSAMDLASSMGVDLLDEDQYRQLQKLGEFDLKTSSWIKTPDNIRLLGGALFCDRRYDTVFVFHNGAESYYASRGFRSLLRV